MDPKGGSTIYTILAEVNTLNKSTNGGELWERIPVTSRAGGGFRSITVDPADPRRLYLAASDGIHTSPDAGRSWAKMGGTAEDPASTLPTNLTSPSTGFSYRLEQGSGATDSFRVEVMDQGGRSLPITLSTTGGTWLSARVFKTDTPTAVFITINTGGLASGRYEGTVKVTAEGASNELVVPVSLEVVRRSTEGPYYDVSAVAGTGRSGFSGDGGPATEAQLNGPRGIAVDGGGNLYIADTSNNRVRRVNAEGVITTVAGNGEEGDGGDGGPATSAQLDFVMGVAIGNGGDLFIADASNRRVRQVDGRGIIRTLADGISFPDSVAVDGQGNVYVTTSHKVVKISPEGVVSDFAGGNSRGFSGDGGPAAGASFDDPSGVSVDASGNVLIADTDNGRIRQVDTQGRIQTVAGNGGVGFNGDGIAATEATLNDPRAAVADGSGNLYIAETGRARIRHVDGSGVIRTVAERQFATAGNAASALVPGLVFPAGLAIGPDGALYVADTASDVILRITEAAGPQPRISDNGVVNAASFTTPIAPGSLFSVFGTELARERQTAGSAPWPTTLAGATVRINGTPAPLFFADVNQINGQAPFELATGTAEVVVSLNGVDSAPAEVTVAATGPGIFQFGAGRAVVQNPDTSVNTASNPVGVGEAIVIYFTGQGALDNPVPTNGQATANPLSRPVAEASVTIGGMEAEKIFVGLSPGFIGLGQANVFVPQLPPGDHAVVITIGGVSSNGPVISVK